MTQPSFLPIAAALSLAMALGAQAQDKPPAKPTAPSIVVPQAKPSAKPAKAETKTLGGKGTASGKMLTREELRQCLARLDGVNKTNKDLELQRTALDVERAELLKTADALKAERQEVDAKRTLVDAWQAKVKGQAQEVEAFNKKSASLDEMSKAQRETAVKELEADRVRLTAAREALSAEEARVVQPYQDSARAYNVRAEARDAKVGEWNARNSATNEAALKQEEARAAWLNECANRPYREDDETAIKNGK